MKNSVRSILIDATRRLAEKNLDSPRLDAEILLAHVLGWRRLNLYIDDEKKLPLESILRFNDLITRRLENFPVAYLTGARDFMGLAFAVNESVLIPRPETEILTELVGEFLRGRGGGLFADLGTGSGAICVSILKFVRSARAAAVDISEEALAVAKFNAEKFHVEDRVNFFCGDLFAPLTGKFFDAIVSNPPYIPSGELETLQAEVRREPRAALDGGADGLNFYRRIISDAPKFLVDGGLLAVEVGVNQSSPVKNFFETAGFVDVEIFRDLAGLERVVAGLRSRSE